jgi:hypothetical protein
MRRVPRIAAPRRGELGEWHVQRGLMGLLPERWIRTLRAVPVAVEPGPHGPVVVVVMDRPDDLAAIDHIAFATGLRVRVVPATEMEIDRAIAVHVEPRMPLGPDSKDVPNEPGGGPGHVRRP